MAIKTFTAGSVLTASDTNTYLANAGLVYINEFTASGSSRALVCDNIFTTTYTNYKIVVKLAGVTNDNTLFFQYINTNGTTVTASYYSASYGRDFATAGSTGVTVINSTGSAVIGRIPAGLDAPLSAEFTVYGPRISGEWTSSNGQYTGINSGVAFQAGEIYAINNGAVTTQRGIRFDNTQGTNITGKVFIYGYRNA